MLSKSPLLRSVPAVLSVAVGCALVWWAASVHSLDFNVYRAGARAFLGLDGSAQLYDEKLWNIAGDAWLPFTYPPFAVLLFLPYAVMPAETGAHIHSVILLMSLLAVVHLIITRSKGIAGLLQRRTDWRTAVLPGLIVVLIGMSGPWREGLSFGQINAALMVILLADLLGARKLGLPRGLLTGLAAGVKLTPLALGLFFLAQRDFKALLWMAAGFFGSVAAGFIISAEGSVYYWTEALWTASRVGTVDDMYNAALRSFTLHLGLPEHAATALWAALSLAAVISGYAAIRRLLAASEQLAAVGVAALVMLIISPISWYHHWVWFILLLPALAFPARTRFAVGPEEDAGRRGRPLRSVPNVLLHHEPRLFRAYPGPWPLVDGTALLDLAFRCHRRRSNNHEGRPPLTPDSVRCSAAGPAGSYRAALRTGRIRRL